MNSKRCMVIFMLIMLVASIGRADILTPERSGLPLQHAISRMAETLQIAPDIIKVVAYEAVEWPDTGLGVHRSDAMYLQVITPGYRIVLEGAGRRYEYHTDMTRRVVLADINRIQSVAGGADVSAPAIGDACRADLAKRLNVSIAELKIAFCRPEVFPDASLRLALPGEVYAQVETPGYVLIFSYENVFYLYTATDSAFRYGGPLSDWQYSVLYIAELPGDPNLNGNLMQVSLAGTNPTLLLSGVNDYYPQDNGSVIAKRRTSRSGHQLLYLAPGQAKTAKVIQSAFDVTEAAVNSDGTQWAAGRRLMVGAAWEFAWGGLDDDPRQARTVALPTSTRLLHVYWHLPNPVVAMDSEQGPRYWELDLAAASPSWTEKRGFFAPEKEQWLLNKSQSLVVKTEEVDGKPVTRVIKEWFTGDEDVVATIENFQLQEAAVTPGHGYALLSGIREEARQSLAVNLRTGEVLSTVGDSDGPVRLLLGPPAWLTRVLENADGNG